VQFIFEESSAFRSNQPVAKSTIIFNIAILYYTGITLKKDKKLPSPGKGREFTRGATLIEIK